MVRDVRFLRQAALLLPSAFLLSVLLFLLTHGRQDPGYGAYPFFQEWAGETVFGTSPEARLVGIDYASASVAESRAHNAALIAAGRMEVTAASVARIPGPAGQFDLVTAVETHYYWPNLVRSLAEIRRVLRPGGVLVVIAEAYRDAWSGWVTALAMAPLRAAVLTVDEHRRRLEQKAKAGG